MQKVLINGTECALFPGGRIPAEDAPAGYPHRYAAVRMPRWDGTGEGIVMLAEWAGGEPRHGGTFHGTLFSAKAFRTDDRGVCLVQTLSGNGVAETEISEGVCPDCGSGMRLGLATLRDGAVWHAVSCECGYRGFEWHAADAVGCVDKGLRGLPRDHRALAGVSEAIAATAPSLSPVPADGYPVFERHSAYMGLEVPLSDGTTADLYVRATFRGRKRAKTAAKFEFHEF